MKVHFAVLPANRAIYLLNSVVGFIVYGLPDVLKDRPSGSCYFKGVYTFCQIIKIKTTILVYSGYVFGTMLMGKAPMISTPCVPRNVHTRGLQATLWL